MSLCFPARRTHFGIDDALGGLNGTGSSPRKYGTNCIIPELTNIGAVGWCGMRPAEGTIVCCRSRQKSVHARRNSSDFIETGRLPAAAGQLRPYLRLPLPHRFPP